MSLTSQDLSSIRDVILDALDVAVNPRLDALENQVDKIEGRMDGLEEKMGGLESRMGGLETRMGGLEGKMTAQESQQQETNRRLASIETKLEDIEGQLIALNNDVKELYAITGNLQHSAITDKQFKHLPNDKKLLTLHSEVTILAKRLGVELPRL